MGDYYSYNVKFDMFYHFRTKSPKIKMTKITKSKMKKGREESKGHSTIIRAHCRYADYLMVVSL